MPKPSKTAATTTPAHGKQNFYTADPTSLRQGSNVGILIKRVQSSLNRMIDQHVSPLGLTAMQWRPMVMIRYWNINTPAELSRETHVDTGAMTRTLDRLEAKNFLTRQRCTDDRRVVKLELTETGQDVAAQILPAVAATLNTHLEGFSEAEIEILMDLLQRMLANGHYTEAHCNESP